MNVLSGNKFVSPSSKRKHTPESKALPANSLSLRSRYQCKFAHKAPNTHKTPSKVLSNIARSVAPHLLNSVEDITFVFASITFVSSLIS